MDLFGYLEIQTIGLHRVLRMRKIPRQGKYKHVIVN